MGCLFFDAVFRIFFLLTDKITQPAKFCSPSNPNSELAGACIITSSKLGVNFDVTFYLVNFFRTLFPGLENDVIWISTVVMGTRNTQVKFHNIISRISSILEIPVCMLSLRNLYTDVQFMRIISFIFSWISFSKNDFTVVVQLLYSPTVETLREKNFIEEISIHRDTPSRKCSQTAG